MKKTYIDQLIIQNRDKNGIFRKNNFKYMTKI